MGLGYTPKHNRRIEVERGAGIEGWNQGKQAGRQKELIFLFKIPDVYFRTHILERFKNYYLL